MNKYRKIVSHRNRRKKTLRRSLKTSNVLKRKQRKITLNNKFRKRYQIGCSRKNTMSGGTGMGAFQPLTDIAHTFSHGASSLVSNLAGTESQPNPSPTVVF